MIFNAPPPPPLDPHDAQTLQQSAERHQFHVLLAQDAGHIGGWIWAVVRRPVRPFARLAGRMRRGPS